MKIKLWFAILIAACAFLSSCEDDDFYLPKPKSYYRIDLPDKEYSEVSPDGFPFVFSQAQYSAIEYKRGKGHFNIAYPLQNARIHCSYFDISDKDLFPFIEDCYNLAYQHNVKATAINTNFFQDDSSKVYGAMYNLKGDAASPVQFYMTDSVHHFLRGSLYFETRTNADSLAPVKNYISQDIEELFHTLTWK